LTIVSEFAYECGSEDHLAIAQRLHTSQTNREVVLAPTSFQAKVLTIELL
jgi:hypothetical protein